MVSDKRFAQPVPQAASESVVRPWRRTMLAAAIFLALTLAVFGDVIFTRSDAVISDAHADLYTQYVAWRDFGFSQLRHGNFALWNPHLYSGAPYFGGLQSGLLYPLNYQYLVLGLAKAINVGVALHIFLGGFFMYLWARRRGLHYWACLLCGVLWMFCGTHYAHVMAGHLTGLISTAWIPLLFLAIDGFFEERRLGWLLTGALAVSMMVLGGDPQYLFHTGVAASIYTLLCLVKAGERLKVFLGLVALCVAAFAIAAVQLLAGMETTAESIRGGGGVPWLFATVFSFPPENFITLVAPGFFGVRAGFQYWGRCYLWEMCLFISVTGLLLALYGGAADRKQRRFSVTMVLVLLVLALGAHTPLFHALYNWVPGFNRFRGMSKFGVQATAFLVLLAGQGLDRLIRSEKVDRRLAAVPLALGALLIGGCVWIAASAGPDQPASWWWRMMTAFQQTRETYLSPPLWTDAAFVRQAEIHAAQSLLWGAIPCAIVGALLLFLRTPRKLALCLALLAAGEMLVFAWALHFTFSLEQSRPKLLKQFFTDRPGDYRVLISEELLDGDFIMAVGANDIWGYGPLPPGRYGQFISASQGIDPDKALPYVPFKKVPAPPIYRMLRCRFTILRGREGWQLDEIRGCLPHVALIQNYIPLTKRNQILATLLDPKFDPSRMVILESRPDPEPAPVENPGRAAVVESGTDYLVIEADAAAPTILLVTDDYAKGWRARGLPDSDQPRYEIMPANYTLRAIPLTAGHHKIRLEYMPDGYRIGRWISLVSAIAYLAAVGWWIRMRVQNAECRMQSAERAKDAASRD